MRLRIFQAVIVMTLVGFPCVGHVSLAQNTVDTTEVAPRVAPELDDLFIRGDAERVRGMSLDTVRAQRYDDGRRWPLEEVDPSTFEEWYGAGLDPSWREIVQGATVMLPDCSGSYASPHGLLLTSYRCIEPYVDEASFYATTLDGEQPVEGLYVKHLMEIADVTQQVEAMLNGGSPVALSTALRSVAIEMEAATTRDPTGDIRVQVHPQEDGDGYAAHIYRKLDDVRLVWVPEWEVGLFGAEYGVYSYPQYAPAVAVLRVYEDGEPISPPDYFLVHPEGTVNNEVTFVAGFAESTYRHQTAAQNEFMREVTVSAQAALLEEKVHRLRSAGRDREATRVAITLKRIRGLELALRDPMIEARKRDAEESTTSPGSREVIEGLEVIQEEKREQERFLRAMAPSADHQSTSAYVGQMLALVAEDLPGRWNHAFGSTGNVDEAERLLLEARLHFMGETLDGAGATGAVLSDVDVAKYAEGIVKGSVMLEFESLGEIPAEDPAAELLQALREDVEAFSDVLLQEDRLARVLRSERPVSSIWPRLRLADGSIARYANRGTLAPPFTSLSGLLDRHFSFERDPWQLSSRWVDAASSLRLQIPLNLVTTADPGGGVAGAPLLNYDLDLVGIAFDTNREGLAGPILYDPERMRTVSVDIRGMFEVLHTVYGADRIVSELLDGLLIETDDEAAIPSPTH